MERSGAEKGAGAIVFGTRLAVEVLYQFGAVLREATTVRRGDNMAGRCIGPAKYADDAAFSSSRRG